MPIDNKYSRGDVLELQGKEPVYFLVTYEPEKNNDERYGDRYRVLELTLLHDQSGGIFEGSWRLQGICEPVRDIIENDYIIKVNHIDLAEGTVNSATIVKEHPVLVKYLRASFNRFGSLYGL
ncbi:MAG TPA: hypothetical protein VJC21_01805 [Candidatus Nanoarchaeia archaeon]|nr:hypothetical protein [Candidatus Nanoarchaeia archaeon]